MALNRRQIGFLLRFFGLLALFYVVVTLEPVNRQIVRFTAGVAAVSTGALRVLGEQVSRNGTLIHGDAVAMDIKNGCNGLEAMVFLAAAMTAFHAPVRRRLTGIMATFIAIQLLNVVRIVTLYLLGAHRPRLFETFHLAVWQSLIFGAAVLMFFVWTAYVQRNDETADL